MLVAVVKYLWNTKVDDIRADIKEYEALNKTCERLKKTKQARYAQLSGAKGCISHKVRTETLGIDGVDFVEYDQETFSECKNLTDSLCNYSSCPFFEKNKNYIMAANVYRTALQNKKSFWGRKFALQK